MSGTVWNQYSALQRWRGGYFAHALSVLLALSSAVQRWTMGPRFSDAVHVRVVNCWRKHQQTSTGSPACQRTLGPGRFDQRIRPSQDFLKMRSLGENKGVISVK
ncbi:hypothetical protein F5890DRAFT_1139241 [Lentinula detonsa]|uniref:Uncharacterized protein n=1 Tax=Lentinula detonsa TaxID=2804962 RepID=A0AA38Q145_9AGAR|nr:hypothetical protein F5890DRAFT_1139241 [Lentinula detonsa]